MFLHQILLLFRFCNFHLLLLIEPIKIYLSKVKIKSCRIHLKKGIVTGHTKKKNNLHVHQLTIIGVGKRMQPWHTWATRILTQLLWGWRVIGRLQAGIGIDMYMIFSSLITFSHLNCVTTLCIKTRIASRAYSFPGHIRGPPPKGTKLYGSMSFPSNLEGSNFSGSGKYLGFLCVECTLQCTCKVHMISMIRYIISNNPNVQLHES